MFDEIDVSQIVNNNQSSDFVYLLYGWDSDAYLNKDKNPKRYFCFSASAIIRLEQRDTNKYFFQFANKDDVKFIYSLLEDIEILNLRTGKRFSLFKNKEK